MEQAKLYRLVLLSYAIFIISVETAWDREAEHFLEQADVRPPLTDGAARHCKGGRLCVRSTGLTDNTLTVENRTAKNESVTVEDSTSTNDRVLTFIINFTVASAATVLSAVTILGNLAVIVTLALEPRLRHSNNLLIMSLSISDLWVGLVSVPLYSYYLLRGVWDLGQDFCMIWLVLDWVLCTAALHSVFLITMDRYMSVLHAVWYRNWRSDSKMYWMIGAAWMFPAILYPPLIIFYIPENHVPDEDQCEVPFTYDVWFSFFFSVSQFWIFAFAMIYFYVEIYKVAKDLGRRVVGSNQPAKYIPEMTSKSGNFSQNWHYVPVLEENRNTILENDASAVKGIHNQREIQLEGDDVAWNETTELFLNDSGDRCKGHLNGTIFLTTSSVKSAIGTPAESLPDKDLVIHRSTETEISEEMKLSAETLLNLNFVQPYSTSSPQNNMPPDLHFKVNSVLGVDVNICKPFSESFMHLNDNSMDTNTENQKLNMLHSPIQPYTNNFNEPEFESCELISSIGMPTGSVNVKGNENKEVLLHDNIGLQHALANSFNRNTTKVIRGAATTTNMTYESATETPIHTEHSRNNSAKHHESEGNLTVETTATSAVDKTKRHVSIALEPHRKTHKESAQPEEFGTGVDLPSIEHDASSLERDAPSTSISGTANESVYSRANSILARDQRTMRTISFIFSTFLVCYSPYYTTMIIRAFCSNCLNSVMSHIAYSMWYINSAINPFLYAYANEKLRASIMRTLRLRPRTRR